MRRRTMAKGQGKKGNLWKWNGEQTLKQKGDNDEGDEDESRARAIALRANQTIPLIMENS